ncbi:hypothetical protein XA68_13591 [Ophiocordyceps unilateralis]|uniref:glycine dehydrogenase (aminomethyl-transferring) n=1 Tax=Ophiocordyceps unilateralis TaxID=268505 RepID=A0A2A9PCF2_OPHUN|nr:hypothetical protein XA68_13591 [Ophiocordyceps unilateralis]
MATTSKLALFRASSCRSGRGPAVSQAVRGYSGPPYRNHVSGVESMTRDTDFRWFKKSFSGPEPSKSPMPERHDGSNDMSPMRVHMRTAAVKQRRPWKNFGYRHIGPRDEHVDEMLKALGPGAETMDLFISQVVPQAVMLPPEKTIVTRKFSEYGIAREYHRLQACNERMLWMNGGGYYMVHVPPVIRRNILENPGWYTSYTPYQAEISQGRLESLLNFQTMVADLTGLPVANASLLDEGTAAAEAMTMSYGNLSSARAKRADKVFLLSKEVHKTTLWVMRGRAEGFGIRLRSVDLSSPDIGDTIAELGESLVGVLAQYPDTFGGVQDFRELARMVHDQGALFSVATDLLALTILTPPGEFGADIALGNSQRFGVPLGYGGPHAAFMAVKDSLKRRLPGRLVGVSKDRTGGRALRLTLQTREQHIRREKATSNVCTSQALLANMAAMYAVYHGPAQLRDLALIGVRFARMLQSAARHFGLDVCTRTLDPGGRVISDTIAIHGSTPMLGNLHRLLVQSGISAGESFTTHELILATASRFNERSFMRITEAFKAVASKNETTNTEELCGKIWCKEYAVTEEEIFAGLPAVVRRQSRFLTHPVFNSHHSETELMRYMHHLQSKDLSLVHSMIPLGSCTMKLNAASQMDLVTLPINSDAHPNSPAGLNQGWRRLFIYMSQQLNALTGMDATSLQPNSGAQGEFAGLRIIRKYHESKDKDTIRDVCLIPVSAHGTNPASATMVGMKVVTVKCDSRTGNLDLADLQAKCVEHKDRLAAIMVTYPSTYGVFEPHIREVCDIVHVFGGLVYMDGANMNAQIGLTSPGALGADVCHLNLHKTFCIPHGGGGPGVGPICVKDILSSFLPHKLGRPRVSSATFGSASILPISWAYMSTMGDSKLLHATKVALLNANYMLARLKDHYPILYTNTMGRCAHEFIIDARPFKASSGIEAIDIAKRLQDYGFHAPTMSWPVPNTLMIEPTESENKAELDRFVDAMISIREEIAAIERGEQPREGNVLKMAPHTQADLIDGDGDGTWTRPYSREKAAYPLPFLREKKFWPTVTRVDDAFGDTNVFCTCPPVEDGTDETTQSEEGEVQGSVAVEGEAEADVPTKADELQAKMDEVEAEALAGQPSADATEASPEAQPSDDSPDEAKMDEVQDETLVGQPSADATEASPEAQPTDNSPDEAKMDEVQDETRIGQPSADATEASPEAQPTDNSPDEAKMDEVKDEAFIGQPSTDATEASPEAQPSDDSPNEDVKRP